MERASEPLLNWIMRSTGWLEFRVILPLALASFLLVAFILYRGKGGISGTVLVVIVPLPFLIGVFGAISRGSSFLQVLNFSNVAPKPSELGDAISVALFAPLVGMILTLPNYALATSVLTWRSLSAPSNQDLIEPAE